MTRHDYWASTSTHEYMRDRAKEYVAEQKFSDALLLYRELMATGVDPIIYYEAASCLYQLGDYINAADYLEKSVHLNDRRWSSFNLMGACYEKLGNTTRAIYAYTRARALKPDDTRITLLLAKLYSTKNMMFEATHLYSKFLQYSNDKRDENYRTVSRLLNEGRSSSDRNLMTANRAYSRKDLNSAKNSYQLATSNYPINYDANVGMARACHDTADYKNAIKYYLRALYINSRDSKILMQIAAEYSFLRDYTRAYCFIKRYLKTVVSNQTEYLNAMKNLKMLEPHINCDGITSVESLYNNNHYLEAFYDCENIMILNEGNTPSDVRLKYQELEGMAYPEKTLSTLYNKTGLELYNSGKIKDANKFFTRVMEISTKDSEEYRLAKAKYSYV